MYDKKFMEAYAQGINSGHQFGNIDIRWRAHVVCWAAQHAVQLGGDFVECGVNTGIWSLTAMSMINFETLTERKWWLLDTYCGLAEQLADPDEGEWVHTWNNAYPECYDLAKKNFSPYPNAILIRGMVPDTLSQVTSTKIAYLSLDMNHAAPEIAAGEFFWDRLMTGALILLDDYAYVGCSKQREAWDDFARSKGYTILSMPTGQGIIIKV